MTDRATDGPVAQSIRVSFWALRVAMALLALGWAGSNIRQIPPDSQAVIVRFGRVVDVQPAGLVLAWPRPFEHVELLPGSGRQLYQHIVADEAITKAVLDPASQAMGEAPPAGVGFYLTGDGGLVLMDATLTYRIVDAVSYYVATAHVAPALRQITLSAAVTVAAGRGMDDFIVARTDPVIGAQDRRETLRGALVQAVNQRLRDLADHGASLGIEVTRADVNALLPPAAKLAFDEVLTATQMAEQGLASARTDAERVRQAAEQERDRVLAAAQASADETLGRARSQAAVITAMEQTATPDTRPSLTEQVYRERIATILRLAGGVSTVDPRSGTRIIMPGATP
jgi:modulator of FtsH protease HflK